MNTNIQPFLTEGPNAAHCNAIKDLRYDVMLQPYAPSRARSSDDDDDNDMMI